jgi:outer membrane protein insertion porin family
MNKTSPGWFVLAVAMFLSWPSDARTEKDTDEFVIEWKVKEIRFDGNRSYSDEELRKQMKLEAGDEFRQWQLDEDLEVIERMYRKNGFVRFSIDDVVKEADVRKGEIKVRITMNEGERVLFRQVNFEGNRIIHDEELLEIFDLERGDPFQKAEVIDLMNEVRELYSSRGHIHMKGESQTTLSAGGDSVDVLITFDEGPRVHVGEVMVEGNELVSDYIIKKGSRLRRGNVVRPRLLQESQQSIYQTNLFKNISLTLEETGVPDTVDILLSVKESDFKSFGVGGGYASVDGIMASIEWNQYHLFSRAEWVRTKSEITYQPFELSRIRFSNAHAIAFTQPFFMKSLIQAQWSISYKISDYETYDQEVSSFKGLFTRTIGLFKRLSLLVDFNSTKIFEINEDEASDDVKENKGRQEVNSMTMTFVLDKRVNLFYPESKDFLTLESTLFGGPLFGDVDFYRVYADYARYHLISRRFLRPVLAARIKLGVVMGLHSAGSVLPGEQFWIGGANSLRGYREQGIGPLGDEGDPNTHSGNYIILFNLETRFKIWRSIGGVLFFDSGNVYDENFHPSSPFFLTSFGAGIRYRSPIGPIRLEGAMRIDRDLSFKSGNGRLHFSVGQSF